MDNVKMSVKNGKLTIEVDLSKDFGPSKSGKTITVAGTGGFKPVPETEGVIVNLNVCRKK
jgi:uncharacterized protein YaiE (UPF0345 family)